MTRRKMFYVSKYPALGVVEVSGEVSGSGHGRYVVAISRISSNIPDSQLILGVGIYEKREDAVADIRRRVQANIDQLKGTIRYFEGFLSDPNWP